MAFGTLLHVPRVGGKTQRNEHPSEEFIVGVRKEHMPAYRVWDLVIRKVPTTSLLLMKALSSRTTWPPGLMFQDLILLRWLPMDFDDDATRLCWQDPASREECGLDLDCLDRQCQSPSSSVHHGATARLEMASELSVLTPGPTREVSYNQDT